ncbi:hypothetical protein OBJ96_02215 [Empedobacter falsenii]
MQYFDVNGNQISEKAYNKIKRKNNQLKVFNDSLKIAKIIPTRTVYGDIDAKDFIHNLSKKLGIEINTDYPTVINYYPGKDPCNTTSASAEGLKNVQLHNEYSANKITTTNFINIYKNKEGIITFNDLIWYKDPNQIVEKTFFEYHYPCSSFVILHNNKYISYFGEYSYTYLLKNLRKIISPSFQKEPNSKIQTFQ